MVRRSSVSSFGGDFAAEQSGEFASSVDQLQLPFGRLEGLGRDELRETAYEIYFIVSRGATGMGGHVRHVSNYSNYEIAGNATPRFGGIGGGMTSVNSKIKSNLGLRTRRVVQVPATPGRPGTAAGRREKLHSRPKPVNEMMQQQLGGNEIIDNRLRKMQSLLSAKPQFARRPELIVIPFQLLKHLKPSDFINVHEYNAWQLRQLKILEVGLVLHPFHPLERSYPAAHRLREIVRSAEVRPLDLADKKSESWKTLNESVKFLTERNPSKMPTEVAHWADGFPLNMHIYTALLRAVFDVRDETVVLDEVDELLELMKKTWTTLGINGMVHNVCFTWVLFEQYVLTGQIEPDLLTATLGMLLEVAKDAASMHREPGYVRVLSSVMAAIQSWSEKKLLDYHEWFEKSVSVIMENVLCLTISTGRILCEDISTPGCSGSTTSTTIEQENSRSAAGNRVDHFIRSSVKNAFNKIYENGNGNIDSMVVEVEEDPCDSLMQLAKKTEELAKLEKETYSPVLRRYHPYPVATAAVTLHTAFSVVLRQYVGRMSGLTNEYVRVLQSAGKLENVLKQMAVEDTSGLGEANRILDEMVSYDVQTIIVGLMKGWMDDRLRMGRECVKRAKETENWHPRSKTEPHAQSAVDLMKLAKVTVDEFFEIQASGPREELLQELAEGIDNLVQEYAALVATCGNKQSYIPTLPPLTRCNQDSRLLQLWKKAACQQPCTQPPCQAGIDMAEPAVPGRPRLIASKSTRARGEAHHPRPTMSRGTQRLYVRLNTLHYILGNLHNIDKNLSFFSSRGFHRNQPSPSPARNHIHRRRTVAPTHFEQARAAIQSATNHVAELAAYRLIFLDSANVFYDSLYAGNVADARLKHGIRALKQNLNFLVSVLADRAQPVAVREVMKASFDAFLLVLVAGGPSRAFQRSDHAMIAEDLANLRRTFCTCGEGLVAEELVETEAGPAEAVVALMQLPVEKLIEEFTRIAWDGSGPIGDERIMPMPPTTGRWSRSDPNTLLRVLCHRDEEAANRFLKRMFDLPKRR
ncbi:Gls protein (DUF810) [Rhynchospora pubera]|uniref:Gls protein (DUF810) n=1 Tax=Rhynchospora pubera TaxID=906938 RepID=A0AAV8DVX2_9POAL|nr:Gls protein (DUF810) [Rhynchospora pubera]